MPLTQVSPGLLDTQANAQGFRNRIINGDCRVDQRNAGASVTPTTSGDWWSVDRWRLFVNGASSKFSAQQSSTAATGFVNSILLTSLSAYTVASTDNLTVAQLIEGLNCSDLGWGTASAQTVTLSFWVRSSLTGAFGGSIRNSASDRSYPFSYTINAANTWEQKTITIPGDTTGTWLTTNGVGMRVGFNIGSGSTFLGTVNTWAAANYTGPTGTTNLVGTNGATLYITGVQLEKGTAATDFERLDYGRQLMQCQRYYEQSETLATFVGQRVGIGVANNYVQGFAFLVQKRAAPTVTVYNRAGTANKVEVATTGVSTGGTVSAVNIGVSSVPLLNDSGTAFTSGVGYGWTYIASAEL